MKTNRTKAIHLLLGLALTLGLMLCLTGPAMAQTASTYTEVSSWADLQTAINNSTSTIYLRLSKNVTATSTDSFLNIPSDKDIVIDLNGKTLSRGLSEKKTDGYVIKIDGGTLTLNDLSTNKTGKITGGKTKGNNEGGGVYLNGSSSKFIMNGGTITGNESTFGSGGVSVSYGGTFTMNGGTIQNNNGFNGGGVSVVNDSSTFIMNKGATISSNTADSQGGGVYLNGSGTEFSMKGGTISDNEATLSGGGVYTMHGTITMSGGAITGNRVTANLIGTGGGVNVGSNGTLAMIGGLISGNTATYRGGGVYLFDSGTQMTISGGTIQNNTAGSQGGGIYAGNSFTLREHPTITGNTVNSNDNNVYLNNFGDTSKIINIESNFTPPSAIGVTLLNSSKAFTSNASFTDDTVKKAFTSDNPAYEMYVNNGQAALRAVPLNLWVGDDQVTGDHLTNEAKTWSFNPWTNTLTLDGYQYEGSGHQGSSSSSQYPIYGCIYYAGDKDLNLEIRGNNSLTNTNINTQSEDTRNSHGIYCNKKLTISGTGTLTTTSIGTTGAMGINCNDYITIKSGTVEAKGNNFGINGQYGITISDGSVTVEGCSPNDSYGINGTPGYPLTIGENVKSVIISGTGKAVSGLYVNNAVKGFGWTDTAGTQGKTVIAINTTQDLSNLKKLQFPVYDVTFKVSGGAWNDGTTKDQTVTPDLDSNGKQILNQNDIPAVGARPSPGYKSGSWNVTPDTSNPITKDTTYVYSYAPKSRITRTVTFKVEHGAWDDGTTEDKTVTLTGYEGDTLKLKQDQIPAVGEKPDKRYTAGNWDTVPNPDTPITADTVYTYAYAKKPVIIPTLYFAAHVQNLGWDKENKTLEPGKSVDVGTTGRSLRMEALVLMVPEAFTVDGFAHVQDVGDLAVREVKSSKDYTIPEGYHAYEFGTTGKSRRVEALCAALRNDDGDYVSGFQYAAHLQNYGWQGYVRNGSFAGTRGMALRMEAMRFAYAFPDVVKPGEPK